MPDTAPQETRDGRIGQLMRQREDAERRRGGFENEYQEHIRALRAINIRPARPVPRLRVVDGQLLPEHGVRELIWPRWEDVRDLVTKMQEVDQELADISRQLGELGVTVPP